MKPKSSLLVAIFLAVSPCAQALNLTWDIDPATPGAQDGSDTWTASSTLFWDGTTNATPVKGTDSITFGATNTQPASPFTVTISNGGTMLNYSDNTAGVVNADVKSGLNINNSFNFAPAAPGDGISIGDINIVNASTVNFSASLDGGHWSTTGGSIGTRNWNVGGGSTLNLTGGGRIQSMSNASTIPSTVNILAGTWSMGGFDANGLDAGYPNMGGGGGEARVLTINHAPGVAITSAFGNFNIGANASRNAGTITTYNLNGGTIGGGEAKSINVSMGGGQATTEGAGSMAIFNVAPGSVVDTVGEIRAGNDGGSGTLNLNGGTFSSTAKMIISRRGNTGGPIVGEVNVNGGTLRVSQVQFGDNQSTFVTGSSATFNLSGGTIYLNNATGFFVGGTNPNLTTAINLSGGTIGSTNNWATDMPITLLNTHGGVTLQADDGVANAKNIILNGALTGNGSLTKTGAGNLNITAQSSYSGGTRIKAGILSVLPATGLTTHGSLGTGDVSVEGGLLDIQTPNAIGDTATLRFKAMGSPSISMIASEPEVLATIVDTDDLTKKLPAGTYTTDELNTFFGKDVFIGGASVTVSAPPVTTDGYADWATANGLTSANNGKAADPDNDGISNLVEYAIGGNPLNGSSRGVEVVKVQNVGGTPALTLTASIRTGVVFAADPSGAMVGTFEGNTYRVEASTDLVNWNKTVSEITPAISGDTTTGAPTGTTYHSFRTAGPVSTTSKEFIRLKVVAP